MKRGVKAGWYPDYEPGSQQYRYWDGEYWTDRRQPAPDPGSAEGTGISQTWAVVAVVAVAVFAIAAVLGVNSRGGEPLPAVADAASSTSSGAAKESASADPSRDPSADPAGPDSPKGADGRRLWPVADALDPVTIELDNGVVVRLVGVSAPTSAACATQATRRLSELVEGRKVVLVRKGPDKNADGTLRRYVERGPVDIGIRLIQSGLVDVSTERHPRAEIYRRLAERTAAAC